MADMVIKKWGNSLAARIPKVIADSINLETDQAVTIEAKDGKIIITPVQRKKEYTLEELLSQGDDNAYTLTNEDKEWLNDEPVGKEW
ncbi:MAG TPA: AbrB family transcriptional regulator [Desulfobacteraceae bacterium]|nr:AbrB family transcriptional regulator [Desulfobacteraceae bacterium]